MAFKKVLGFWDLFWLGIGGMVGVAILTFPSVTYQQAGPSSIISWIAAGIFSLLMALIYAEMVTAFPRSGALVTFPYEAFGRGKLARYLAFLEGIGYYLGTLFGIVISAIIIGNYMGPAFSTGTVGSFAIAEISLIVVGAINLLGARITSRANLVMSIFFISLFALVIILALMHGSFAGLSPFISGSGIPGIVYAIPIAILAYGSWTALITIPEEATEVKKIPKAIIYSIIVVTVLYALMVLVTYMNLNANQLANTYYYYPVLGLVTLLGNPSLAFLFDIAAVLSMVAVMLVMVLSNTRIAYALSKLRFAPSSLGILSRNSIPVYATIASFAIPMVLSAFPSYYYQYVIIGAIIGTGLPRVIDLASYLRLRKARAYKPSFRVRYGIVVALAAAIGLIVSELSLALSDVLWSVAAFILLTLLFLAIERRRSAAKPE